MNKSNELRRRLPALACEMYEQIGLAIQRIHIEAHGATSDQFPADWRKGMVDALLILRGCREAQEQFRRWIKEVVDQSPDGCGLTREEREALFGEERRR